MDRRLIDGLAEVMAPLIREHAAEGIRKAMEPMLARIAELEARVPEKGEKGDAGLAGERGADGAPGNDGKDGIDGANGKDGAPGADGKDIDLDAVRAMIAEEVAKLPPAVDGKDGRDGVDGAPGVNGKDADPEVICSMLVDEIAKIPPAPAGKDGADGLNGKDGTDGRDGLAGVPGRDGKDGLHGKDGLGFEHMEEELRDGGRVFVRRYRRGDEVKEFEHKTVMPVYRLIWQAEREYEPGDQVTWRGSIWTSLENTKSKPGDGNPAWILSVKCGADGRVKDAPPTPRDPIRFK